MGGQTAALRSSLLSSLRPPHLFSGPLQHTHRPRPGTRPGPRSGEPLGLVVAPVLEPLLHLLEGKEGQCTGEDSLAPPV